MKEKVITALKWLAQFAAVAAIFGILYLFLIVGYALGFPM